MSPGHTQGERGLAEQAFGFLSPGKILALTLVTTVLGLPWPRSLYPEERPQRQTAMAAMEW
jgi:hypothetical protein